MIKIRSIYFTTTLHLSKTNSHTRRISETLITPSFVVALVVLRQVYVNVSVMMSGHDVAARLQVTVTWHVSGAAKVQVTLFSVFLCRLLPVFN